MNDPMKTHGALSWTELRTPQIEAAKTFYHTVLGWDLEEMPQAQPPYTIVKAAGVPIGGMTLAEQEASWLSYITVDDVDQRVAVAREQGATIVQAPFSAPGVGRMATLQDPTGALLAFITYEAGP